MTRAEMISFIHDRLEHADLRELEMICGLMLIAGAATSFPGLPPAMVASHGGIRGVDSATPLTLSVSEAADRLGIPVSTMYEIVKTDGFPTIRIGTRILVSAKGLEEWVAEQAKKGW